MLHRLSLRVIPSLNALVTESSVRKRKRLVMLAPGFIAFLIYRLLKLAFPLTDPFILLSLSGILASVTALWAYRMGRQASLHQIWHDDGFRWVGWVVGWIGFAYGVQLSLLVLALLKVFVGYDFLLHPDGPGMMAIIISCTSVTRDAFEIGYVRYQQQHDSSVLTFPDGTAFRQFVQMNPSIVARWMGLAVLVGIVGALPLTLFGELGDHQIVHALLVSVIAACMGNFAFWVATDPSRAWWNPRIPYGWWPKLRFWAWPCLTFSVTYYLVQVGMMSFLFRMEFNGLLLSSVVAGTTTTVIALYAYYLGNRKFIESQLQESIPSNLQSCPFVMSILNKTGITDQTQPLAPAPLEPSQPQQVQ
ncbi:MAG: hypothetical protein GKS05_00640 [Nitrospirales bacterium]|nr:hypothetical protein [Nitrospirales bacterium]